MPTTRTSAQMAEVIQRLGRTVRVVSTLGPRDVEIEIVDVNELIDIFDAVESAIGYKLDCIANGRHPGVCVLSIGDEI